MYHISNFGNYWCKVVRSLSFSSTLPIWICLLCFHWTGCDYGTLKEENQKFKKQNAHLQEQNRNGQEQNRKLQLKVDSLITKIQNRPVYTAKMMVDFMASCQSNGGTESQCACVFDKIQSKYTPEEMSIIEVQMFSGQPLPKHFIDFLGKARLQCN